MILSDDSLRGKLHISVELFQKLTHFQMRSLNDILENPPISLIQAVTSCSSLNLIKYFIEYNISLHAGEYSYNVFESYLRDIIIDWNVIREDRVRLLNAISRFLLVPLLILCFCLILIFVILFRNSATQVISIPIFLGLWRALEEFQLTNNDTSVLDPQNIQYSLQMLQLHFVDLHYIYALIYDRLFQKIHPNQQIIRFNELLKLMTGADIRLTSHSALLFEQSLRESNLLSQSPENKINIQSLFFVSKSLKAWHLEQLEFSQSQQNNNNNHNNHNQNRTPSSSLRYIQAIQPKWKQIRNFLIKHSRDSSNHHSNITYPEFTFAIQCVGGTVISPLDMKELWRYIALIDGFEINGDDVDGNLSLRIEAFDEVMKQKE